MYREQEFVPMLKQEEGDLFTAQRMVAIRIVKVCADRLLF